jgi:hypothetical protein
VLPEASEGLGYEILALRLTMDLVELPSSANATSDPGTTSSEGSGAQVVELTPLSTTDVVGPFTFQFSLTRQ